MAVADADSTWLAPGKGAGLAGVLRQVWETESARLTVWSPLLLVTGIWTYFGLPVEPQAWVKWIILAAVLPVAICFRQRRLLLIAALIALGFAAAMLRTASVGTPVLAAFTPDAAVTGRVAELDQRSRNSFVLILDVMDAAVPPAEMPRRIRLTWSGRKLSPPEVGSLVRVTADLSPLPRPVLPGGFDYGRQLFFQSIGATGRIQSLEVLPADLPWRYVLRAGFHDLRAAIGQRIRQHVAAPYDAIAEALITGERAAIPRAMNQSLIESGLFHILSISGLHMTLVAGGVFWVVRAGLALSPALALRRPIKKWAAAAALAVGTLYMLLADGGAATERAFLMIAVVFFAVLVDRPAISLHNLAVAAVVILLWQPEQAVSASFQMSFIAVMGLAAFYPIWSVAEQRFWPQRHSGWFSHGARWLVLLFAASLLTSLIAGGLSGLVAVHHFGRMAPFGIVANALAMPVVGIIVMPMAMLAVLLMPLGLEAPPLWLMQQGLEVMMLISDWIAGWPYAGHQVPLVSAPAAVAAAMAAALLCLPLSPLRWLCVPAAALAAALMLESRPQLLVDERAANVALITPEGVVPALAKGAPRSLSIWQDTYADAAAPKDAARRLGWICDQAVCKASLPGMSLAFALRSNELRKACPAVDVLIAAYPLRRSCKGRRLTIDRFDVWRNGAYAITIAGDQVSAVSARAVQGERPWTVVPRRRNTPFTGRYP